MEKINKILNKLSEINLDKKGKCMVRGDVQGLAYCQGFDSCIEILSYELYKTNFKNGNKGE